MNKSVALALAAGLLFGAGIYGAGMHAGSQSAAQIFNWGGDKLDPESGDQPHDADSTIPGGVGVMCDCGCSDAEGNSVVMCGGDGDDSPRISGGFMPIDANGSCEAYEGTACGDGGTLTCKKAIDCNGN